MRFWQVMLVTISALCLFSVWGTAYAQDDEVEGHIYTVSTQKWPFNNLEEIFALMEETQGLVEENEYILSRKVLTHSWAGEFSVMIINEYASMADIDKAQKRGTELFNAKYPDEEEREARSEKLSKLMGTSMHNDSIVQEVPALTK